MPTYGHAPIQKKTGGKEKKEEEKSFLITRSSQWNVESEAKAREKERETEREKEVEKYFIPQPQEKPKL